MSSKEDIAFRKVRHLFYILLLVMSVASCSHDRGKSPHERIDIATIAMSDTVFICTSNGAKRFHASDTCGGILSCGEEIEKITREEAEHKRRTFCHKCFKNITN